MRPELQRALIDRVFAHLAAQTTDTAEQPGHARAESYLEPEQLQRERRAIFRGVPLPIAHRSAFAGPGDFVVRDVDGVSVLLVRNDDGSATAFLNVCRHRGTQLVWAAQGQAAKSFRCPYHGWNYSRDGTLGGVPHSSGFPGVDRTGLIRLPCTEIAGLVFVRLTPSQAITAEPEAFDAIADDLSSWQLGDHHVDAKRSMENEHNWKLGIDIFLEAYHLRTTHERTIYRLFFDNLGLVDPIGPHTRNVFPKQSIRTLADAPREAWRVRDHANVLYHLFPNTLVLMEPDHAAVIHVYPLGPHRSRVDAYTLIPTPAITERARAHWDKNNEILFGAIAEDFAMGDSIQRGLASGANETLTFGRFEHALTRFHDAIAARVQADTSSVR